MQYAHTHRHSRQGYQEVRNLRRYANPEVHALTGIVRHSNKAAFTVNPASSHAVVNYNNNRPDWIIRRSLLRLPSSSSGTSHPNSRGDMSLTMSRRVGWVASMGTLTLGLPEHPGAHELEESVGVETGPVHWDRVLRRRWERRGGERGGGVGWNDDHWLFAYVLLNSCGNFVVLVVCIWCED